MREGDGVSLDLGQVLAGCVGALLVAGGLLVAGTVAVLVHTRRLEDRARR